MEIFLLGGVFGGMIIVGGIGYALRKSSDFTNKISALETERDLIKKEKQDLQDKHDALESENKDLQSTNNNLEKEKSALETKVNLIEGDKQELQNKNAILESKNADLQDKNTRLQTQQEDMQDKIDDWEKTKAKFMQHAKTASLQATQDLLEKNKAIREEDKQELEKEVKNTTQELHEKYDSVTGTLKHVDEQVKQQQDTVNTIEKALSNPLEVGTHFEINLENTLQAFDLQSGIDYQMQMSSADGANRPDAVIFLPNDSALVIDAKSSKNFWDIAQAEQSGNTDAITEAYKNLKDSMNKHLKDLSLKTYRESVLKELQNKNPNMVLENISLCMFVGSDVNIGKIDEADNRFILSASDKNVSVVAKSGLYALISLASRKIQLQQQIDNNRLIIKELESLVERIAIVSTHGEKVTKGLHNAQKNWDAFVSSFDTRVLPSTRKIQRYGVAKEKNISFLNERKNKDFIDAQVEVIEPNALPNIPDTESA